MAGNDLSDPAHKNNKGNDVDMHPTIPFATSNRMAIVRSPSNLSQSSHNTYSTYQNPTCTPKRRRKEDGKGSRIRFSPEKKTQWRESISRSGSLLDEQHEQQQEEQPQEDDEISHLEGAGINIPHLKGAHIPHDELSYSDSDASPPVRKDLSQELVWEQLGDDKDYEVNSPSIDEGESYASKESSRFVYQRGVSRRSLEVLTESLGHRHLLRRPPSPVPHTSMVGGVVTVEDPKSKSSLARPKSLIGVGRQVSVCSELTMEELVSETSSSSHKSGNESEGESITSCDEDASLSSDSDDSGVSDLQHRRHRHHTVRHPRVERRNKAGGRRKNAHGNNHRYTPVVNNRPAAETTQDSLQRMWSTGDNCNRRQPSAAVVPRQRRPGQYKRRKGPRPRVCSTETNTAQDSSSFLFPFQHSAGTFESAEEPTNSDTEAETSILLDLTEDLKEFAIIAGKSSENLVSNILSHLYEG